PPTGSDWEDSTGGIQLPLVAPVVQRLRRRAELAEIHVQLEHGGDLGVPPLRDVEDHHRRSVVTDHHAEAGTAVGLIHLAAGEAAREAVDHVTALEAAERVLDLEHEARAVGAEADVRALVLLEHDVRLAIAGVL